jgi:hypothetical protein
MIITNSWIVIAAITASTADRLSELGWSQLCLAGQTSGRDEER